MKSLVARSASVALTVCVADAPRSEVAPDARAKPPPILKELEDNDSAARAAWFGMLRPGSSLSVAGHVGFGGPDPRDGFVFSTAAPCTIRFALRPVLPSAELDLCVYDPSLDAFVACFDSRGAVAPGEIDFATAGTDFHIVVGSAWGSASYVLEIEATPRLAAPAEPARAAPRRAVGNLDAYRRRSLASDLAGLAPGPASARP